MLVTSPGTAPRTSARARYGRRHPGSKGPSKEFIFFFFKRNGPHSYDFVLGPTTIAVVLEAKPIGIITRVVAMEGNPLETEAASCRIRVQLFESTCKRKSILHIFFIQQHSKRNHQSKLLPKACVCAATTSQRCMCLAYHELCIYNKTNNKGTNETDYK